MFKIKDVLGVIHELADALHTHSHIDDGESQLYIGEGVIGAEVQTSEGGFEFEISGDNANNLLRALNNPDDAPTEDSDNLMTSGAIATALAAKADGKVNQVFDNFFALTNQMEGKVLEVNNSFHRQLQQIITTQNVHYHLNSATLTNGWFLIRPYRLLSGSNNWFVEVLGAWD